MNILKKLHTSHVLKSLLFGLYATTIRTFLSGCNVLKNNKVSLSSSMYPDEEDYVQRKYEEEEDEIWNDYESAQDKNENEECILLRERWNGVDSTQSNQQLNQQNNLIPKISITKEDMKKANKQTKINKKLETRKKIAYPLYDYHELYPYLEHIWLQWSH